MAWRRRSEFRPRLPPDDGTGACGWRGSGGGDARVAIGRRDARRQSGAVAERTRPARHRLGHVGLAYALAHSGSAQPRISSSWLCCVRSSRSGVTETRPCSTAWKSVPGASAAEPTGPIQTDRVAIGRGGAHHGLGRMALAQAGHLEAMQILETAVGDIDVEQHRRRQRLHQMAFDHLARGARAADSMCSQPFSASEKAIAGMPNR